MTISRKTTSEPISGLTPKKEKPSYCASCETKGLKGAAYILGNRVYDLKEGEALPSDADKWLQCGVCGMIVPKYDIPQTGSLTTDIEIRTSKFPYLDVEKPEDRPVKDPHKRGFNPRDKRLSNSTVPATIKDREVIQAIRKGAKLISYSET